MVIHQPNSQYHSENVEMAYGMAIKNLLARLHDLAPSLSTEANGAERGSLKAITKALNEERIFSMLVPTRYGGLELAAPDAIQVIKELARLNGDVAWNVMTGQTASLIPFLASERLCDEIYGDGKPRFLAGSGQAVGVAERHPDGWRVKGRWPFVSGCEDAEWIGGACVMMENGAPIPDPSGHGAMVRAFLMPAKYWRIQKTWCGIGLKDTGSHHAALDDVVVPEAYISNFPFGESFAADLGLQKVPETMFLSHAAIADLVELAKSGRKQQYMSVPLAETDRFKEGLARLRAEHSAAQTFLEAQALSVWRREEPAHGRGPTRCADQAAAAVWITSSSVRVAEGCFELAGGSAVYETSPIGRRMQDIRVAAQHALVHARNYVLAGGAIMDRLSAA
jgi:indole-3-acetate monooxygenase